MANNLKTNPIGLDASIHKVQQKLYDDLVALWSVSLDGYPRCYEFNSESGRKTVNWFKSGKDYEDVIVAERNKFFFTATNDENNTSNDYYRTNIDLFFIVDTFEIKPNISHRADAEVRADVLGVLSEIPYVKVNTVITDSDKVFNRLDFRSTDDLQPYHCFKINLEVYDYTFNQVANCN